MRNDYEGQLNQRLARCEISTEEHADALRLFNEAKTGSTPTAELGMQVLELVNEW